MYSFLSVNTGVRHGCALPPSLFSTCMGWVFARAVDQSHFGASVSNMMMNTSVTMTLCLPMTQLSFGKSLEVFVLVVEALNEKKKPLELHVSWSRTKEQVF